eukprot:jgi/Astpho2/1031/Aster-00850
MIFVTRMFEKIGLEPEHVKQRAQLKLREMIEDATSKGELWTRQWDKVPLDAVFGEAPPVNAASSRQREKNKRPGRKQREAAKRKSDHGLHGVKADKLVKRQKRTNTWVRGQGSTPMTPEEVRRRQKRAQRFGNGRADDMEQDSDEADHHVSGGAERDWASYVVVGTSEALEKWYLRLTAAPRPGDVRPPRVLRAALERLVALSAAGEVDYFYLEDQFKALRQDATVQHLRDELAVQIYEAHGRAALEYGDREQFNQCQSQLHVLYGRGCAGCRDEFLAYRLLYQMGARRQAVALLQTMQSIPPQMRRLTAVVHALEVRRAYATCDHTLFWELYSTAPKLGRAVMDFVVPTFRFSAAKQLVEGVRPTVPVSAVAVVLGFWLPQGGTGGAGHTGAQQGPPQSEQSVEQPPPGCSSAVFKGLAEPEEDQEEAAALCLDWLHEHSAVIKEQPGGGEAQLRLSEVELEAVPTRKELTMPVPKTAVAHGDVNLDVHAFLAKFKA